MKKINTLKSFKSKSLNGIINVPGDKSISHRALIFLSLSYGSAKIKGLLESTDVFNTCKSLQKLGVKIIKKGSNYEVFGNGGVFQNPKKELNLGNSGTGVRLMIGMLASRNVIAKFKGDKSLTKRPMLRILKPLKKLGAYIEHKNGFLPLEVRKSEFLLPSTINETIGSAQVKSAVILAALNIIGTTTVNEKIPSRNHSEILLNYLGANLKIMSVKTGKKIQINGPIILHPRNIIVPGDFSSASFLIVACLLCKNSKIIIKSVGINFYRVGLLEVLKKMGGKISLKNKKVENGEKIADIEVESSQLSGQTVGGEISVRLIDEYPILFVAASFAKGTTIFKNLEELKFKESDRLNSMAEALRASGVRLKLNKNSITIFGNKIQKGGCVIKTSKDHRIAMSMLIFGMLSNEPIQVDEIQMIKTSFPGFFELFKKIGANIKYV